VVSFASVEASIGQIAASAGEAFGLKAGSPLVAEYMRLRRTDLHGRGQAGLSYAWESVVRESKDPMLPLARWLESSRREGLGAVVERRLREIVIEKAGEEWKLMFHAWWTAAHRDAAPLPGELSAALKDFAALGSWSGDLARYAAQVSGWRERLATDGALRFACGADEEATFGSVLWLPDIFAPSGSYQGTRQRDEPISSSLPAMVLGTHRVFTPDRASAWTLPLAPGRFSVRIHIAEPWYPRGGLRTFALQVENQTVPDADPGAVGPGRALELEFHDLALDDGLLDFKVQPHRGEPVLAAIEILRLDM